MINLKLDLNYFKQGVKLKWLICALYHALRQTNSTMNLVGGGKQECSTNILLSKLLSQAKIRLFLIVQQALFKLNFCYKYKVFNLDINLYFIISF